MTAIETLSIKNFAGIQEAEIELSRMNVFIGPQASGKSVCAKLLFYFREVIRRIPYDIDEQQSKPQIRADDRDLFLAYFPAINWSAGPFEVLYTFGMLSIGVKRKSAEASTVAVSYSSYYNSLLRSARTKKGQVDERVTTSEDPFLIHESVVFYVEEHIREKLSLDIEPSLANEIYFIPAGRSFFSTLQNNVFSFIAGNIEIDPFLAQFGRLYERMSYSFVRLQNRFGDLHIKRYTSNILRGSYKSVKNRGFIVSSDNRQVAVENSSSGQQEALPLIFLLASVAGSEGVNRNNTLFVEEPEAHLYPTAQREIVHLLAAVTDLSSDETTSQYVITTHSPYILSALNNLMYGAQIAQEMPGKRSRVTRILGDAALVDPANVRAYAFGDGRVESIIDQKTGLVRATMLDGVSNELAKEFGALLDVAFEEMAA